MILYFNWNFSPKTLTIPLVSLISILGDFLVYKTFLKETYICFFLSNELFYTNFEAKLTPWEQNEFASYAKNISVFFVFFLENSNNLIFFVRALSNVFLSCSYVIEFIWKLMVSFKSLKKIQINNINNVPRTSRYY